MELFLFLLNEDFEIAKNEELLILHLFLYYLTNFFRGLENLVHDKNGEYKYRIFTKTNVVLLGNRIFFNYIGII